MKRPDFENVARAASPRGRELRRANLATLALCALTGLDARLAAQASTAAPAPEPELKAAAEQKPWRLDDAIETPDWLKFSGSVRVRYEGIEGQFRALNIAGSRRLNTSDHMMVMRTLLRTDLDFDTFGGVVELIDSRHFGAGTGSFLNTTVVNPIDFLQAHATLNVDDVNGGKAIVRVGRYTMDIGSRRLSARNRYRNTINAFDGIDAVWSGPNSEKLRAFWNLPVRRRPADFQSLVDNDPNMDNQTSLSQFFGVTYERELAGRKFELYALGLNEHGSNTRRRKYFTPGGRIVSDKKVGCFDYEWEAAMQFGERGAPGAELDHLAYFTHIALGYTFDAAWKPRVQIAFDYASGDSDGTDSDSGRFDTLFGARRWEYGPTGIYGAIARSNISSPDVRVQVKPNRTTTGFFAWRGLWLAQSGDTWTTARLTDNAGNAGNFVGHQIETRWRFNLPPKSLRLEVGAAHLFAGDFIENVAQSRGDDTTYAYAQVAFTF